METEEKRCWQCSAKIEGRRDKKFCDAHCRSAYHHNLKVAKELSVKEKIEKSLNKNRKILKAILNERNKIVSSESLKLKGFDFNYFTHCVKNKKGAEYRFCFEYGYLWLDGEGKRVGRVLVVRA